VQVSVRGGVIEASFQTSSAEATQLLSHSLAQLKHALENHGVTVDRLHVAQAPARAERPESTQDRNNPSQQNPNGQSAGGFDWQRQSDQQRREIIRRMWARLGVGDPLDLVA
jgi:flagellar hook-length control protein FliK